MTQRMDIYVRVDGHLAFYSTANVPLKDGTHLPPTIIVDGVTTSLYQGRIGEVYYVLERLPDGESKAPAEVVIPTP